MKGENTAVCNMQKIDNYNELEHDHIRLVHASETAVSSAYAPYSKFKVGAAVLLGDGHIVSGSNQENMAYPSGLCAERVALFAAGAQYPTHTIKAISVCCNTENLNESAEDASADYFTPCGACRQVIFEYEWKQREPIIIYLKSRYGDGVRKFDSIQELLPYPFVLPR